MSFFGDFSLVQKEILANTHAKKKTKKKPKK